MALALGVGGAATLLRWPLGVRQFGSLRHSLAHFDSEICMIPGRSKACFLGPMNSDCNFLSLAGRHVICACRSWNLIWFKA